jgi:hypothetical protein
VQIFLLPFYLLLFCLAGEKEKEKRAAEKKEDNSGR